MRQQLKGNVYIVYFNTNYKTKCAIINAVCEYLIIECQKFLHFLNLNT